jgi:DNA-binding CsgD family transcriptional regulator
MNEYNLESLLSVFIDLNKDEVNEDNIIDWVNQYAEISKPDFLMIMNVKSLSPVVYFKNYNLEFSENSTDYIQDILDGMEPSQKQKIISADSKVVDFAFENYIEPLKCTYYLRFNTSLIPNKKSSFIRSVTVLSRCEDDKPHFILSCIDDVTNLNGTHEETQVDIKNYVDGKNVLSDDLKTLKKELDNIFEPKIILTKRERQILKLISEGYTSSQIANSLNISIATVNTHRQNLIRKNNVTNTAALLNTI